MLYLTIMLPKCKITFQVANNSAWGSLHCKISRQNLVKLGIDDNYLSSQGRFIGVLTRSKHKIPDENGLFVTLQVVDDTHQFHDRWNNRHNALLLHTCDTFMRHYGFTENDEPYIQYAKCLPLKCVVFGAKTDIAYEWMQSKAWSSNLALSVAQGPTLCRRGDILLIDPASSSQIDSTLLLDISAMDCSPVSQGLITLKTRIVVLRTPWQFPSSQEVISPNMKLFLNLFSQVTYTSRLLMPSPPSVGSSGDGPSSRPQALSSAIFRAVNKKFKVSILPKPIKNTNRMDVHAAVFLNSQVLTALKLEEGVWSQVRLTQMRTERDSWSSDPLEVSSGTSTPVRVLVRQMSIPAGDEDASPTSESYLVRLYAHSEPDNMARVTPILWFNLNAQPSPLEQPNRQIQLERLLVDAPPYAKEVYVCLVQTPFYKVTISCDELLKRYFTLTRCLRKGDIIALSTIGHAETHNQNWKDCLTWPVVYFQVSRIEGASSTYYLVDTHNSRLYQSGACQSFLPVTMEAYDSPQSLHPVWHSHRPPGMETHVDRLAQLITPFLQNREFRGQVSSCILVRGQVGSGKTLVIKAAARSLNIQIYCVDSQDLVGESPRATEARFKYVASKALTYAPCILVLKDVCSVVKEKEALGEDPRIVNSLYDMLHSLGSPEYSYPVVTVATSSSDLSSDLQGFFLHQIQLDAPTEDQRLVTLQALLAPLQTSADLLLQYFAQRTVGMVLGDLSMLVSLASQSAFTRLKKDIAAVGLSMQEEEVSVGLSGVPLMHSDMMSALEQMHLAQAQAIGAPQIPDVRWEDVGGLEEAKKELLDTVQLPLLHPHLMQAGLRRSGVLLHGPPGTGKTLLAKAVATECSLSFLSVKGPELINAYVGQSEENIREVFHRARSASPCIIFFDELDSLGPNRGRSGDSGGVMDRVVSQLLAELDGLHKSVQVFVIGATNRPDLLDPALLRPGRFDRLVYVGLAKNPEGRLRILQALTRKFNLDPGVDLSEVESLCPSTMTGADFYGLCAEANMAALGRCIHNIQEGLVAESEARPEVTMDDFLSALRSIANRR